MRFEQFVEAIAEEYAAKRLFIRLVPPLYVEVVLDARDKVRERLGLSKEEFDYHLRTVEHLLIPIMRRQVDAYLEHLEVQQETEKEKGDLKRQAALIEEHIVDDRLRARFKLKVTSKAPAFVSLDWDVKIKVHDAKAKEFRFPYATLRLNYQRDFDEPPLILLGGRTFDSAQVNFTLDEVDHLMHVLDDIRAVLSEAERGAEERKWH